MNTGKSMQDMLRQYLEDNPDLPDANEDAPADTPAPAGMKRARLDIVFEKKGRGGKQATIVTGFDGTDSELLELAATLKKRLGTGGSARGGEILIQGDRRKQLLDLLTSLGYKARII